MFVKKLLLIKHKYNPLQMNPRHHQIVPENAWIIKPSQQSTQYMRLHKSKKIFLWPPAIHMLQGTPN